MLKGDSACISEKGVGNVIPGDTGNWYRIKMRTPHKVKKNKHPAQDSRTIGSRRTCGQSWLKPCLVGSVNTTIEPFFTLSVFSR